MVDDDKTSTECSDLRDNQWVIKFKLHNHVGIYPYPDIRLHKKIKSVITGSHSDQVSVQMDRAKSNEHHEICSYRVDSFDKQNTERLNPFRSMVSVFSHQHENTPKVYICTPTHTSFIDIVVTVTITITITRKKKNLVGTS
ncbi:hypothetical protein BOTCAL_0022g00010 [Botryotinia calthae]|uniref:Uncharacterized protein n=1 Tax=Botryotinia calthae TaxID=38488 RepID=A0A4Y8DEE5_9HELO|nr:hypothetical protein BOTCAL_0022g00010 [Botryotinia calthae]